VAQRRQMPDRKVWPGRWWPAAKTSTPQDAGELPAARPALAAVAVGKHPMAQNHCRP